MSVNEKSDTFPHFLKQMCQCGTSHHVRSTQPNPAPESSERIQDIHSYRDLTLGDPARLWEYRYSNGQLAGYVARWNLPDGAKEIRPLVLKDGRWRQKGIQSPRPLFNLLALSERPDAPVLVVEGEKTAEAARDLLPSYIAVTSMGGAKAPHLTDWIPLSGRHVILWPDHDPDGLRYTRKVAKLAHASGAANVRAVTLPEQLPAHWDLADPIPDGVDMDVERLLAEAELVVPQDMETDTEEEVGGNVRRLSPGDQLLQRATEEGELYADGDETFADVWIDGVRETWPVRSRDFKRWLRRLFYESTRRGATQEALTHTVDNLDAQAARAGQRKVYLRIASHEGKLYVDLGDSSRHVVEIDEMGWRILTDSAPVRFRRSTTMLPLPEPTRVKSTDGIEELRRFLNVGDEDFVLCVAWLLASLTDTGPYPLLALTGEHGTAKSTAAAILRSLVDPSRLPTRGMPRDERDAAIATRNNRVLVFDNLSGLPTWFSDVLCRFSTGEGFATRALHTDGDEFVIEASLPVILTSIENIVVRGDLADRAIVVRLEPIADTDRLGEAGLLSDFEEARPRIFGVLLDGLSEGLRQLPHVRIERLPRMADFATWMTACEGAYWPAGTFMAAFDKAQESATEDVLEGSQLWQALRVFLEKSRNFNGTASELLNLLNAGRQEERSSKNWPSTGAVLGKELTRLAPLMRKRGYVAERTRTSRGNSWRLESPGQAVN